jgi:hypothetical protein
MQVANWQSISQKHDNKSQTKGGKPGQPREFKHKEKGEQA